MIKLFKIDKIIMIKTLKIIKIIMIKIIILNRTRFAHACLPFENSSRNSGQSGPESFIILIIFDDYVTDDDDVDDNEFDYDNGDAD